MLGEVESTKSVSEIYAPVAGKVVEVNDELSDAPERLNDDPYGDGVDLRDRARTIRALGDALLDAAAYRRSSPRSALRRPRHGRGPGTERLPWTECSATTAGTGTRSGVNFCSSCGAASSRRLRDDRSPCTRSTPTGRPATKSSTRHPVELAERHGRAGREAGPQRRRAASSSTSRRHQGRAASRERHLPRRHHGLPASRRARARADDGYAVRDVGSLNGTYVNRERIEEAVAVKRRRGADRQVQARLPGGGGRVSPTPRAPASADYLSIGDVLTLLRQEFPDITISKIRFLESQGLVNPERTPSGYRKFYEHDVERLRWVLRQQREHFLPLKVIKGRLEQEGADANGDFGAVAVDDPGSPSRCSWAGRAGRRPAAAGRELPGFEARPAERRAGRPRCRQARRPAPGAGPARSRPAPRGSGARRPP